MNDSTPDEIARLRRIIEAQNKALAHWRSEADRDAGTLKRYSEALYRIAHTDWITMVQCKRFARHELEYCVAPGSLVSDEELDRRAIQMGL